MVTSDFDSIVSEINRRSKDYEIGNLAQIRKYLKGKTRLPIDIFPKPTTFNEYAFHYGGRQELQFNMGMGMVLFLAPEDADGAIGALVDAFPEGAPRVIGEVVAWNGSGPQVRL